ncbi:hypothetical protein GCM10010964_36190 [Caldovatus sediminis]|uniref:Uncharacterized protein n=1 Tax=Caldovatus sediminis TaxID=2041189 RepID=A0A8J2ZEK4_9PROT|nr:hypothetical protein GCM10010964_36190 [Caldovatus sediminis]
MPMPVPMPRERKEEDDSADAWLWLPRAGDPDASRTGRAGVPAAPEEVLVAGPPGMARPGSPDALGPRPGDAGPDAAAPTVPDRPSAPAATHAAWNDVGRDEPSAPLPNGSGSRPADREAERGPTTAPPRSADTPAPGAAEADLPAACNAAASGEGQEGPGRVPSRPADPPGRAPDHPTGHGPPHPTPPDRGLPADLAALAAALDAESRAADAWLDDFLAGRVALESAFHFADPRGAADPHDWPFG